MLPPNTDMNQKKSAETLFREAFERLRNNSPFVLKKGSKVSQNNVAREAGCDPSALRKSRFPSLVGEIQRWVAEYGADTSPSKRIKKQAQRSRNRSLREQIDELKAQRDCALSLMVEADAYILDQAKRIAELEAELDIIKPTAKKISLYSNVTIRED
jgi:DNA repair exonuclease SbcCD ATPase subunit